ncbi:MAG TPA: sulfotransferase domain-containing protein [Longimicrobiales bacterium]
MLKWLAIAAGAAVLFLVLQFIYLAGVLAWSAERTRGLGYYGLPPDGRARYKAALRRHARLLRPLLRLIGRFSKFSYEQASIRHADLTGPKGTCTEQSFARGMSYRPRPEDVFVVTQMKCGTTWMQHVVYEVVQRGRGDIVEAGRTLYGIAPWLEAETSVPVDQAPLHGAERPSRIIKTHLPAGACPFSPDARYIYVARHPVSCFASCADFIATNMGVMTPPLELTEQWFCSDAMWWSPWTDHVSGWWHLAQRESNVLFIRFEDMKRDLPGIVIRVAEFLGVPPLDRAELEAVVRKCSFAYMQEHKDAFEMNPPHLLQTDAEMFVRGTADRHRDVPDETRRRILAWCAAELDASGFDVGRIYPELTAPR